MKKNIFIYTLLASLVFVGCKKDDGMVEKSINLERVPYINVNAETGSTTVIVPSTIATFTGKVVVSPLYPSDALPTKVDVVIIKNGVTTNVKTLKAGITTFPTTVTFTGPELATLFGTPTVTCDNYTIGTIVYVGDKKYETWPTAAGGAPGFAAGTQINQPGYSVTLNYNTKEEFDPAIFQGTFVVVSDLWQDMAPGDLITLNAIDATHFGVLYSPAASGGTLKNAIPFVVTIDPNNSLVPSVALQTVGTGWTYDGSQPVKVQTTTSANNSLSSCAKTLSLNLNWTQGLGSYTGYVLKLKKQ